MKVDKSQLPGARILKSIIALSISLIISRYIFNVSGFHMTVAVFLSMKQSPEKTKAYGKNRIIGTLIGGIVGYIVLLILKDTNISEDSSLMLLINVVSVFFLLWFSKVIKLDESETSMGCVVFLSITLLRFNEAILPYVASRVIETIMGVFIAMGVNQINFNTIYQKITNKIKKIRRNRL